MATDAELTRRLGELERRMDLVFDPKTSDVVPGVQALLDAGNKVGAIALIVERTGMGLNEARRTVEQMVGGS